METMEVMNNEVMDEVVFVAEEIVPKSGKNLKVVGKAAVALAVGYGIYRGAKWAVGKIKAKKEEKETIVVDNTADENVDDYES